MAPAALSVAVAQAQVPVPAPAPAPAEEPQAAGPAAAALPIVLLLPPRSSDFGRAAAALRAGFRAAHERHGGLAAVDVVEGPDDAATLAARYREFAARGVAVVVGPLTRAGVNALADLGALPVPTLTLNQPDVERALPANALAFGLPIEGEVRQLARLAFQQAEPAARRAGRLVPRAAVVSASSPLGRRAATAFHEAWREQGGVAELPAEVDPRATADLRAQLGAADVDAVFVAGGVDLVRAVRSAGAAAPAAAATPVNAAVGSAALASGAEAGAPVYATSLVSAGLGGDRRLPELNGVRVVEMPWLVLSDHATVAAYPKPQGTMANRELQRLYALGIDAFRVALELGRQQPLTEIDGATGRLSHDGYSSRIERVGVLSEFRNGVPAPLPAGR